MKLIATHLLAAPWPGIPLRPPDASTGAASVDQLHFFLTAITLFFTAIIFAAIFYFMIKYRRRSEDERPAEIHGSMPLEIAWSVFPLLLVTVVFIWSSSIYFSNANPPRAAMEIFVVGKQWMWHIQHPEGPREINALHVPVNIPIKLTMTSEDVIHDFYIPAFRIKRDVIPGRYSTTWFQATETGAYHLFCAQYCGAEHAMMIGTVYVMTPADYAQWLSGGAKGKSMAQSGEKLFSQLGCVTCHAADNSGRCPSLEGLYGKPVKLRDGRTLVADEAYLRQAILSPNSTPLPGYAPVMPGFQGQINEEQLLQLIAYIKSLGQEERKGK